MFPYRFFHPLFPLILLLLAAPMGAFAAVDFNREVRPILSDRCFACHGPDAAKREAGLRLDTFEGATATLKSGDRAVVPGKPAESALISRIHTTDPDDLMPPAKLNRPLNDGQRRILERWVESGATYDRHWAFTPPQNHSAPAVKDSTWPRDDIDRFILAKLDSGNLTPNPEAERSTLLRRVSFVLTGLPPTPEQLAAFAGDPSPDALEKQVDALLASPRFGERMALDWLDSRKSA